MSIHVTSGSFKPFARLADLAIGRSRSVLFAVVLVIVLAAVTGAGVRDKLTVGGFADPGAESTTTEAMIEDLFEAGPANHVFVVTMLDEWVYSPANAEAGLSLTERIAAEPGVTGVTSFWSFGEVAPPAQSPLRDLNGQRALIALRLTGDENQQRATAERLDAYVGKTDHFSIEAAGAIEVSRQAADIAADDLAHAELLAAPLTLLALIIVFRGVRAGLLPLVVAVGAVLGTFAALGALTLALDVSVFAVNLTTALGLGLAIDYSLLIVSRFREELAAGRTVESALHRTLQTAGRTVVFSAATVAASLVALLVFPIVYLRSFAYAGVLVVSIAAAAALVVLPSLLVLSGKRLTPKRATSTMRTTHERREPFWGRQARRVLRHPALWACGSGLVLAAMALPFLGIEPGRIDDRALPSSATARSATDDLREHFSFSEASPIAVFVPGADSDNVDTIVAYEQAVLAIPGVVRVDSPIGFTRLDSRVPARSYNDRFRSDDGTWFSIVSWYEPDDPRTEGVVAALRSTTGPYEAVMVGGPAATVADTVDSVLDRLPLALGIIAAITMVLLFMLTGSPLMAVKAVVLNLASLTATFGALVWVFQDGHLSSWLGFTATGKLDVFTPILMFCIAFGLSMDYEVFVLARIKEEYDLTGSNHTAIINGLARTGGLVTAAAVVLTIVFIAIATSGVTVVKMLGAGLALAVLVDAFVVRATLTPALMALAGRLNWWAPRPLRRFHLRWGVWESDPLELPT